MSGVVRGAILTAALLVGAFAALLAWAAWLHSFASFRFDTPTWVTPYEQFLFILVSAPVLLLVGGFAFWLYEPRRRSVWTIGFSAAVGAGLSYLAPVAMLRGKPLILGIYWVAIAALAMLVVLFGSWLAAKLIQSAKTSGAKGAA